MKVYNLNNLENTFLPGDGIYIFSIKENDQIIARLNIGLDNSKKLCKLEVETLRGLKNFFIYGGKRKMRDGNIEIIPMEDALKNLPELLS